MRLRVDQEWQDTWCATMRLLHAMSDERKEEGKTSCVWPNRNGEISWLPWDFSLVFSSWLIKMSLAGEERERERNHISLFSIAILDSSRSFTHLVFFSNRLCSLFLLPSFRRECECVRTVHFTKCLKSGYHATVFPFFTFFSNIHTSFTLPISIENVLSNHTWKTIDRCFLLYLHILHI